MASTLLIDVSLEPERMNTRIVVDGIPPAAVRLEVTRTSADGARTYYVRGAGEGAGYPCAGQTTVVLRDYEVPFNVPLFYQAMACNAADVVIDETRQAAFELAVPADADPWLVDLAVPANSLAVVVESLAELTYEAPVGVHRVLDRRDPVVTTAPAWTPTFELILCTLSEVEREKVRTVIGAGLPVLLRTTPEQGVGNLYLAPTGFSEARVSRLAFYPERRWQVAAVQVARPDPALYVPLAPNTYAEVAATYTYYGDITSSGQSYEALAYSYGTGSVAPEYPPWLPDDA